MKRINVLVAGILVCMMTGPLQARDATDIIRDAINHWRGVSSVAELTMIIHRPDWQRSMSMKSWTLGEKQSLVRITAPAKDRGNGTLIDGDRMWSYSPKVNRVIKIPPSMMGQSWMGSDFSNKDISRTDEIVEQYHHTLLSEGELDGVKTYQIESIPHEDSAVVWGREVLVIREDSVMISHHFYDQEGLLVKYMETLEFGEMGGRSLALRQRMQKVDHEGEWTEMSVDWIEFNVDLGRQLFTLSNLRNPRT